MEFAFTEEQDQLREVTASMVAKHSDSAAMRKAAEGTPGYDPKLWALLAEQLGAMALAIPEEQGGAGFSLLETLVVMEELGRGLVPSPFLGSAVLSTAALVEVAGESAAEQLEALASGELIAALAWAEHDSWELDTISTRAEGGTLTGTKQYVLDAATAGTLLVVAADDHGLGLYLADPGAEGVTVTDTPTMDQTRLLGEVRLEAAPGTRLGEGDATEVCRRVLAIGRAGLAMETVGSAAACFADVVAYVKERQQFGRAIGSFQAIKHRLADAFVLLETARSAAYAAAWAVSVGDTNAQQMARTAKAHAADSYFAIAAESIQLHGGVGITWEYDAHFHFKRAQSAGELFGAGHELRRQYLQAAGTTGQ